MSEPDLRRLLVTDSIQEILFELCVGAVPHAPVPTRPLVRTSLPEPFHALRHAGLLKLKASGELALTPSGRALASQLMGLVVRIHTVGRLAIPSSGHPHPSDRGGNSSRPTESVQLLRQLPADVMSCALGSGRRHEILSELEQQPGAAREVGAVVGLSPQAANWHIRSLARYELLTPTTTRRRRAFYETVWRTTFTGWRELGRSIDRASSERRAASPRNRD